MTRPLYYRDWTPGLDNDHLTLGQVLSTMPASPPDAVPAIVRLLENPASPVAFPGAVTLERHDAIHVLLGRGMLPQDEAFTIGFTMGATYRLKSWHVAVFKFATRKLYPRVWRFRESDMLAFDLGLGFGAHSPARDLQDVPFEKQDFQDMTLAGLRADLGIPTATLRAYFRKERLLIPDTEESRRLDIDDGGVDPSAMARPDGADSDWPKRPRRDPQEV